MALVRAARRGVDVRLALPGLSDSELVLHAARSSYSQLLRAGVRIYERKDALLHAKTAVIEGVWSTVGSTNLDWCSLLHNEEVNVVIFGDQFGSETERMFSDDISASEQIIPEQWAQRACWTERVNGPRVSGRIGCECGKGRGNFCKNCTPSVNVAVVARTLWIEWQAMPSGGDPLDAVMSLIVMPRARFRRGV